MSHSYMDNPELHELFAAQANDFVVQDQVSGLIWNQFLLLCIYQHVSRCISSQPVDKLKMSSHICAASVSL